jgi:hypothetical protein
LIFFDSVGVESIYFLFLLFRQLGLANLTFPATVTATAFTGLPAENPEWLGSTNGAAGLFVTPWPAGV